MQKKKKNLKDLREEVCVKSALHVIALIWTFLRASHKFF